MKKLFMSVLLLLGTLSHAQNFPKETAEAKALVDTTVIRERLNYCAPGTLTCRSLVLLNDKATGAPVSSFYNTFISAERAVGSSGYIIQNTSGGTFHATLDTALNGKIEIDTVYAGNENLTVTFDSHGLPTVHNVTVKVLGTTRYTLSTMTYSQTEATIIGVEYDSANSSYSKPYSTHYKRVK